jgi:hypothetical protein
MNIKPYIFSTMIIAAFCGCRLLETGYGDDNVVIRTSADTVSAAGDAARSTLAWASAKVLSFGNDLDPDTQARFISIGEHSAAAYRVHPDLPKGYTPLSLQEFSKLNLTSGRYRYEAETGFIEDTESAGFGARLSRLADGDEIIVAFRGSNAPGEDEHWMQDWIYDAQQGGGGTPKQYVYGLELLSEVRNAFHDASIVVTGHSLGGGIAAYSTMNLADPRQLTCATYNAAGISSITLLSIPNDVTESAAKRISNIRSKGDPVSAIPGTQLLGDIYEVDNLRFANHSIDGLLIDMRRRAEGRRAGWLRDLMDD